MRTRRTKINESKEEEAKVEDIKSELTSPLKKRRSRIKSNELDVKETDPIPEALNVEKENSPIINVEVHEEKTIVESELILVNDECNVEDLKPELINSKANNDTHLTNNDTNILQNQGSNVDLIENENINISQNQDSNVDLLENENISYDMTVNDKILSPSEDTIKLNSIVDIVPCEEDFQPNFEGDEEFEPEDTQKPKSDILNEEFKIDIGLSSDIDLINVADEKNISIKNETISNQKEHSLDITAETGFIPSSIIHVHNLVRPFTLRQLKELFRKFGEFDEDNDFWIDKIKSHCIIKFKEDTSAAEAIKELDGQKWPASNPKMLKVEYSDQQTLDRYKQSDASLTPQTEFRKSSIVGGNEAKSIGPPGVETNVLAEIDNHNTSRTSIDSHQDSKFDKSSSSVNNHQNVLWNPNPFASTPTSRKIIIKGEADKSIDGLNESAWISDSAAVYDHHGDQRTKPQARGDQRDNHNIDRSAARRDDIHAAHQTKIAHVKEWDKDKVVDYHSKPPNDSHSENYAAPAIDGKEDKGPNKSGQLMDELFSKTHTLPCVYWLPLTVKQMEAKVKELGVAYVYEKDIIKTSHSCKTYRSHPYENIEALRRKQDAFMPPPHEGPYYDDAYSNAPPPYPPAPYNEPKWSEAPYDRKDKWDQGEAVANHNPFPMMKPRGDTYRTAPGDFDPTYQPRNFLSRDYDYSRRRQQRPPPYAAAAESNYPPPPQPYVNSNKRDFDESAPLDGTFERSGPFPSNKKGRFDDYHQPAPDTRPRDFDSRGDSRNFKRDVPPRPKHMNDKERFDRSAKETMKRSRGESRERRSHRR